MALVVGTDTYLSLTDAGTYVTSYVLSTDAKYIAWAALSDAQKEVLMRRAAQIIDRQPMDGVKAVETQTMEFPKAIHSEYRKGLDWVSLNLNFSGSWYVQTEVPTSVKYAQVEIALALAVGESARLTAQREGVKAVSIGKISETYVTGNSENDIPSREARELLSPYIRGGFGIA
jgi:hypothetical protein